MQTMQIRRLNTKILHHGGGLRCETVAKWRAEARGRSPWPGLTGTCSPAQFCEIVGGVSIRLWCVMDAVTVVVGTVRQGRYCSLHPRNTDTVYTMMSNVLRDLPVSRNQQLKLANDWYIRILKNKIKRGISAV
jgi:hypothetical protein